MKLERKMLNKKKHKNISFDPRNSSEKNKMCSYTIHNGKFIGKFEDLYQNLKIHLHKQNQKNMKQQKK